MATIVTGFVRQVPGLGTERALNQDEIEHAIVLLRVVERLPIISDVMTPGNGAMPTYETLVRTLRCIHAEHLELASMVNQILKDSSVEAN